jgi:hypothetical protein
VLSTCKSWTKGEGSGKFDRIYQDMVDFICKLDSSENYTIRSSTDSAIKKIHNDFLEEFVAQCNGYFSIHFKLLASFQTLTPTTFGHFEDCRELLQLYIDNNLISCSIKQLEVVYLIYF